MKPRLMVVAALIGAAAILFISIAIYRSDSQPASEPQLPALTESAWAEEKDSAVEEDAAVVAEPPRAEPPPVDAAAPGQAASAQPEKPRPAQKRRVALRITGTVEDAQGQPLENALLSWIPLGFGQAWQISRDAVLMDGDASRLPPGPLQEALLRSRTARSAPDGAFLFEFDRTPPTHGFVAVAAAGARVTASLENRKPLESLSIDSFHQAQTDKQGDFELKNLTAGKYRLIAGERVNYMVLIGARSQDDEAPPFATVEVDGQTDASGIVLTLDDSDRSRLSGVVVDELGQPIENAAIAVFSSLSSSIATSGPDGTFEVRIQGKGPFQVVAQQSQSSKVTLPKVEAGRQDLRIVLNRPGFISGRVITPNGTALPPGARIEVRPFAADDPQSTARRILGQASAFAKPAQDGTFRIEAAAEVAEVVARVPGFAPANFGPVTVQPGGETGNVEILLTRRVAFRHKDEEAAGLGRAWVGGWGRSPAGAKGRSLSPILNGIRR